MLAVIIVTLILNLQGSHTASAVEQRKLSWKQKPVDWGCFSARLVKPHLKVPEGASQSFRWSCKADTTGRIFIYLLVIFMDYLLGTSNLYQNLSSRSSVAILALFCMSCLRSICHIVYTYLLIHMLPHPLIMSPWKAGLFHNHFFISSDFFIMCIHVDNILKH